MPEGPFPLLLLVSGLLFLGTVGYLVINAGSVAELFGRRRRDARPGDMVVDRHGWARRASPGAIKAVLALHVLGIGGLLFSALTMTGVLVRHDPGADPLPAELDPLAEAT